MGKGDVSTQERKSLQRVMLHSVICLVYGVCVCVPNMVYRLFT